MNYLKIKETIIKICILISYISLFIIISYHLLINIHQKTYQIIQSTSQSQEFQFITKQPKLKLKTTCSRNICTNFKEIKVGNISDKYFISYTQLYNPKQSFLILYVHGQNEVFNNKKYMNKLQTWAKLLNKNNNILVAPNLFSNSIDNAMSFNEILLMTSKLKIMFPNIKIYLLAFSRGGMIAYKIIANKKLLDQFDKIIILAGVLPYKILTLETCTNIRENYNKIEIYHGNSDMNVPSKLSTNVLIRFCNNKGYKITNSIKYFNDYDHWKLGYTKNIYEFLNY